MYDYISPDEMAYNLKHSRLPVNAPFNAAFSSSYWRQGVPSELIEKHVTQEPVESGLNPDFDGDWLHQYIEPTLFTTPMPAMESECDWVMKHPEYYRDEAHQLQVATNIELRYRIKKLSDKLQAALNGVNHG